MPEPAGLNPGQALAGALFNAPMRVETVCPQAAQDHGPDVVRLANALSALYPEDSEEKRLLAAMLLAVPK